MIYDFTTDEYEHILSKAGFNKEQKLIFKRKQAGVSRYDIADELNCSVYGVDKKWKRIKNKILKVL